MTELARLLEQIERVPPMSPAAQQLLRLQGRRDSGLGEFSSVVEVDPGLAVLLDDTAGHTHYRRAGGYGFDHH